MTSWKSGRDIEEIMGELQREKEEALAAANQEAAQQIGQLQVDLAKKIQAGEESQKRLRTDLEKLQTEREAEMKKLLDQMQEQAKKMKATDEECERLRANSQSYTTEMQDKIRALEESRLTEKERREAQLSEIMKKKTGEYLVGD